MTLVYAKKKKKIQPQNKGPGMLWGQSYVTPMTSCDVISMMGGGVCHRGGVCHGKLTSLEISIIPHISTKINYILTLCALLPIF